MKEREREHHDLKGHKVHYSQKINKINQDSIFRGTTQMVHNSSKNLSPGLCSTEHQIPGTTLPSPTREEAAGRHPIRDVRRKSERCEYETSL
jgi:hypothetical protein